MCQTSAPTINVTGVAAFFSLRSPWVCRIWSTRTKARASRRGLLSVDDGSGDLGGYSGAGHDGGGQMVGSVQGSACPAWGQGPRSPPQPEGAPWFQWNELGS